MWTVEKPDKSDQVTRSRTLDVIAGVDAVPRHGNVLVRVVQRLQEGNQVLVVGQLLCDGEGHHHHFDRPFAFGERVEQRGDGPVKLLHGAPRGRWRIAVVLGITHPWNKDTVV